MKAKQSSAIIALSFGIVLSLVLPLQTYLGNASAYAYGLGRLVAEQAVAAAVLSAVVWALIRHVGRTAGTVLSAVLTGILTCAYLETGPLSFGLPELSGDLPEALADSGRKAWDAAVWIGLIAALVGTCRWTRNWLHWVALAVLVLGVASLFDIREEGAADETKRGGYELSADIIDNVEYSPARNVLLFVLDNADTQVAADIVAKDAALAAKFPGFTAYRNNVGMHDSTKLGVPGIMTGKYFEPGPGALVDYVMSVFGEDSFLQDYIAHGDAIYSMFCTCSYGYTTAEIPTERQRVKAEGTGPVILRRTAEVPYLTLADAVAFRVLPFAFKRQHLANKLRHRDTIWSVDQTYDHEQTVFPILAARPVSAESRQMFGKFHTHGGHPPFLFGAEDYRGAVSNALSRLGVLFDALREKGVYDRSFIVVAADHGAEQVRRENEPYKSAAMLWAKPEGEAGAWAASDMPTSHAKLATLFRKACGERLTAEDVSQTLHEQERLFRQRDRKDRHECLDWIVHADRSAERR